MGKRLLLAGLLMTMTMSTVFAGDQYNIYVGPQAKQNKATPTYSSSKYDHIYMNPPKHSLAVYGRYIMSSSTMRYVNSASKLKRERHSERVSANNRLYAYGY